MLTKIFIFNVSLVATCVSLLTLVCGGLVFTPLDFLFASSVIEISVFADLGSVLNYASGKTVLLCIVRLSIFEFSVSQTCS
jgi:hypothetical protein